MDIGLKIECLRRSSKTDSVRKLKLPRPHTIAMDARERFLKIYANIPLSLRREIILVLDNEPITWNVAYVEVFNRTEKSKKILKKLEELKLI